MPDEAPHPLSVRRFVPLALLVLAGALFFTLEGHRYLSFTALAEHRERLSEFVAYGGAGAAPGFRPGFFRPGALSVSASGLLSNDRRLFFVPLVRAPPPTAAARVGPA